MLCIGTRVVNEGVIVHLSAGTSRFAPWVAKSQLSVEV